jgi:very-short-patch-repair endonuclease
MGQRTIDDWFRAQDGLAVWQLLRDGHSRSAIRHACGGCRALYDGVYLSGHAAPTDRQRWRAATLTTPTSALAEWSSAALFGLHDRELGLTTIVRPGHGSRKLITGLEGGVGPLLVTRSLVLREDIIWVDGIATPSAGRTVLDLQSRTSPKRGARLVRDAIRLDQATTADFRMLIGRHHGRRGVARLHALVDEYAPLPLHRTRSDAEALALAILQAARVPAPLVNTRHAGEEADFAWLDPRLIVELDGPQYHQFATEDARKQAKWENAGFTVRRLSTDDVYDNAHLLLAACPPPQLLRTPGTR